MSSDFWISSNFKFRSLSVSSSPKHQIQQLNCKCFSNKENSPDLFGDVATDTPRWLVNKFSQLFWMPHLKTSNQVFVSTQNVRWLGLFKLIKLVISPLLPVTYSVKIGLILLNLKIGPLNMEWTCTPHTLVIVTSLGAKGDDSRLYSLATLPHVQAFPAFVSCSFKDNL